MKEKKFKSLLEEFCFSEGVIIPVYYCLDDKKNIILDLEGMEEEFNLKIEELKGLLNGTY